MTLLEQLDGVPQEHRQKSFAVAYHLNQAARDEGNPEAVARIPGRSVDEVRELFAAVPAAES